MIGKTASRAHADHTTLEDTKAGKGPTKLCAFSRRSHERVRCDPFLRVVAWMRVGRGFGLLTLD